MKNVFFCVLLVLANCVLSLGQTYQVLYSFGTNGGTNDGAVPNDYLVFDSAGNAYGTTKGGGNSSCGGSYGGCGTVFKLSPNRDGTWSETVIYAFCQGYPACTDGWLPYSGLILDSDGNLYGTTMAGGSAPISPYGTAFELSPQSDGTWTESVLWNFSYLDAWAPSGRLVFDGSGNLYSTTYGGGTEGRGTVFELSPSTNGWTKTTIHNFDFDIDGGEPYAGVRFDQFGNLWGANPYSSCSAEDFCGAIYELSPNSDGTWSENTVYSFAGFASPVGEVTLEIPGSQLYVPLPSLGAYGGLVRMSRQNGGLQNAAYYNFNGTDGRFPQSGLLLDFKTKSIYGTTIAGGSGSYCAPSTGCGTIYQIHNGQETVLYELCSQPQCTDGSQPSGALTAKGGSTYGTTEAGGPYNLGVVFKLTP